MGRKEKKLRDKNGSTIWSKKDYISTSKLLVDAHPNQTFMCQYFFQMRFNLEGNHN